MKLTFIWQNPDRFEREWITQIFEPIAGEQVADEQFRVVRDNCLLIDSYIRVSPREYYEQFRGKNAWLLHLGDETYEGGYERYECFRGVFRSYWSGIFNPQRVMQLPLGYTGGMRRTQTAIPPASERPYLWSFLGAANKSSRPEMMKALMPLTPHFVHLTDGREEKHFGKEEYKQILHDSVFVPSSMGNVNLDCFRIYEALESGAIPILEKRASLDYFAELLGSHPLPTFGNWRHAAKFMAAICGDRGALDNLQRECLAWWTGYQQTLRERIERFVDAPPGKEAGRYIHWRHSLPGWQAVELMRHHTVAAFARRLKVQFERLTKEGNLRKTSGA